MSIDNISHGDARADTAPESRIDAEPGFVIEPTRRRVTAAARAKLLADPGFGRVFTDHMVTISYKKGVGWHDARVRAYEPIPMDPASAVLHYSQEIFEGLKAYRCDNGSVVLFRAEENANRFRMSAQRLAMPQLPQRLFLGSITELCRIDRAWIPPDPEESLYLRPFMYASERFLGVRPSNEYLYVLIASPVASYFKGGLKPVNVWLARDYSRAARGGTGAAKCGGNYAASLAAQEEAERNGCQQVVFLDAARHRYVEELGGMNVFFVYDDGTLVTPPLAGTILPGVTRDSVITLARAAGHKVEERPVSYSSWRTDARVGRLREVFACGTAAVLTPIGAVRSRSHNFTVGGGGIGEVTMKLRTALIDIQRGRAEDPYGWVQRIL